MRPTTTVPHPSDNGKNASASRPDPNLARMSLAHPVLHMTAAVAVIALAAVAIACGDSTSTSGARERSGVKAALDTVRSSFAAADPTPLLARVADDVQLHSPALMGPEYRGREVVASIVTPAVQVLEDVRVTDVVETEDGLAGGVVFDARVGDQAAQGFVLLRTEGEQVREITLLLRPLPALRAFVTRMGELGAQPALDAGKRN